MDAAQSLVEACLQGNTQRAGALLDRHTGATLDARVVMPGGREQQAVTALHAACMGPGLGSEEL